MRRLIFISIAYKISGIYGYFSTFFFNDRLIDIVDMMKHSSCLILRIFCFINISSKLALRNKKNILFHSRFVDRIYVESGRRLNFSSACS